MKKLNSDEFEKDNQPNKGPDIDADFISQKLSSYNNLLNSGIIEKATCRK